MRAGLSLHLLGNGGAHAHSSHIEALLRLTYFINGRRETPFAGKDRYLVPSPKVPTYDLQPEMSTAGITETAVERIRSGDYDFIAMNYANANMVGHTGVIMAFWPMLPHNPPTPAHSTTQGYERTFVAPNVTELTEVIHILAKLCG